MPKLFTENVKTNSMQHLNENIPYQFLIIEELSNYVIETGIEICTKSYKLKLKMKRLVINVKWVYFANNMELLF